MYVTSRRKKKTKEGYLVDEPETMKKKKKVSKG